MEDRRGKEKEGSRGEEYGRKRDRVEKEGEKEGSWWKCVEKEEEGEGEEVKGIWKKVKDRMDKEKRREEEKVRERKARERRDEQVRRERKRRNLVWRGIEGDNFEERCLCLRVLLERMLERKVALRGVEERIGDDGKSILLVVLEKEEEVLERRGEVGRRWRMSVDENLTREERKMKWRIKERARLERSRGKRVEYDSRRLWIEGKEWKWDEEVESWREYKEC
ncbi:unnamed protein product [Lasius platythorax]|uniref:Uncharacterized protein n=2 Tax=Lasius TaxID=488720 RepID=A0A0J7KHT5_LASNI|nr:hypothetical protein RF55_10560 [Lasius niger]